MSFDLKNRRLELIEMEIQRMEIYLEVINNDLPIEEPIDYLDVIRVQNQAMLTEARNMFFELNRNI
ncbi:hypothetical protein [Scytonema sp. NUACC26]|uniref:hypothetical protein n=1 Tax=Scytonema sp. NUACC26 TaxID=3140176 RepID=UPI0034DC4891